MNLYAYFLEWQDVEQVNMILNSVLLHLKLSLIFSTLTVRSYLLAIQHSTHFSSVAAAATLMVNTSTYSAVVSDLISTVLRLHLDSR